MVLHALHEGTVVALCGSLPCVLDEGECVVVLALLVDSGAHSGA